jgi:hypothetical protein
MVNTKEPKYASIKKVYRQHNSLVITLPVWVLKSLGIGQGSYVSFEGRPGGGAVKFSKIITGADNGG